jgi:hypothetical protein
VINQDPPQASKKIQDPLTKTRSSSILNRNVNPRRAPISNPRIKTGKLTAEFNLAPDINRYKKSMTRVIPIDNNLPRALTSLGLRNVNTMIAVSTRLAIKEMIWIARRIFSMLFTPVLNQ